MPPFLLGIFYFKCSALATRKKGSNLLLTLLQFFFYFFCLFLKLLTLRHHAGMVEGWDDGIVEGWNVGMMEWWEGWNDGMLTELYYLAKKFGR